MADKRGQRRGGYYWIDGQPFISVTNILGVIDKPALRYWFGQQVYRAMMVDPTLGEKEALSSPYKTNKKAMNRGTTVHSIVEAWRQNQTYIDSVPEEFQGYAKGFYDWVNEYEVEIQDNEKTVVSQKYGYAGTLDLIVKTKNGRTLIVDCKTGKDIYNEAYLQLSAYRQALREEGTEVDGVAVLLLQEDGGYKYQPTEEDCFRPFFACKVLWEWINAAEYEQVKTLAERRKNHGKRRSNV